MTFFCDNSASSHLRTMALATLLIATFSTVADARKPKLNHKTFVGHSGIVTGPGDNFVTIRVGLHPRNSQGRKNPWTHVPSGQVIDVPIQFGIGIWDGYITDVFLRHRHEFEDPNVTGGSLVTGAHNDLGPVTSLRSLNVDDLPDSVKSDMVSACNRNANENNGFRLLHRHNVIMRVWTRPHRRKKAGKQLCEGGSVACNQYAGTGKTIIYTREGQVPINIQCEAPTGELEELKRQAEITNASLSIKKKGKSCPYKAEASVMIFGEGKRKVRYRILRQNAKYNSPWYEGRLKKTKILGSEGYALVRKHNLKRELGPGKKKFRLEIQGWNKTKWQTVDVNCPPFKVKNVKLSIKGSGNGVACPRNTTTEIEARTTGPGDVVFQLRAVGGIKGAPYKRKAKREGNVYVARYKATNKASQDIDKVYEAFANKKKSNKAKLKISCLESVSGKLTLKKKPGTQCKAQALVAVHTNTGGKFKYELECGSAGSWKRSIRAPKGNNVGVDKVNFSVKHNQKVTCILRTRIGGNLKPLSGASKTFSCPTNSFGSNQAPPKVGTFVAPQVRCLGGKVVGKKACVCPPNKKKKKIGKNAYRCVPKNPVVCLGGNAKPNKCVCPPNKKKVKIGKRKFKCVPKPMRQSQRLKNKRQNRR